MQKSWPNPSVPKKQVITPVKVHGREWEVPAPGPFSVRLQPPNFFRDQLRLQDLCIGVFWRNDLCLFLLFSEFGCLDLNVKNGTKQPFELGRSTGTAIWNGIDSSLLYTFVGNKSFTPAKAGAFLSCSAFTFIALQLGAK